MPEIITLPLAIDVDKRLIDTGNVRLTELPVGDTLVLQLSLYTTRPNENTALVGTASTTKREVSANLRRVTASIGRIEAAPDFGTVKLYKHPDGGATADIAVDETASSLKTKLEAAGLSVTEIRTRLAKPTDSSPVPGLWMVRFTNQDGPIDLRMASGANMLWPESMLRVRAAQVGDVWWHELRMVQMPIATNLDGFARTAAEPPTIGEVQAGNAGTRQTAIQRLTIPAAFGNTPFTLAYEGKETELLSAATATPAKIASSLNALFDDDRIRFETFNFVARSCDIRFTGPLENIPVALIAVRPKGQPPLVTTTALPLDREPAHEAVRTTDIATGFYLELELELVPDNADPDDTEIPGRIVTLARQAVSLARQLNSPEVEARPRIDWLRRSRTSFVPSSETQVFTGQAFWAGTVGDGEAVTFPITHGLDNENIAAVALIDKVTGRVLKEGEYDIEVVDSDQLNVHLAVPPAAGSLAVVITAAGTLTRFAEDLELPIDRVINLQSVLDVLFARLSEAENKILSIAAARLLTANLPNAGKIPALLHTYPPFHTFTGPAGVVEVPAEITRTEGGSTLKYQGTQSIVSNRKLLAYAPLSPAGRYTLSSSEVDETIVLLAGSNEFADGNVYKVTAGTASIAPNPEGLGARRLEVGEYVRYGLGHYYVVRKGASDVWYPADYEAELLAPLTVIDLPVGRRYQADWSFSYLLASFDSSLLGVAKVVVETANISQAADVALLDSLPWVERQRVTVVPSSTEQTVVCQILVDSLEAGPAKLLAQSTLGSASVAWEPHLGGACTANASTDELTCAGHGLTADEPIRFLNTGGSLPAPLSAATTYYATPIDANRLTVSTTPGGSNVNITTVGTGTHKVVRQRVAFAIRARLIEFDPAPSGQTDSAWTLAGSLQVNGLGGTAAIVAPS